MMINTTFIMYSHTSCSDLWEMFTSQTEKYLNVERKVVFTNTTDWSRDGWDVICYDDSWTYPEKVCHCLEQVDSETCMINLEDFPLYDKPNIEKLKQINEEVKKNIS